MFEFLQFCDHAEILPVLCVNFDEDMAGLVEYLWGDANSTRYGGMRAADGHPAPYRAFPLICSNEEPQQACDGKYQCYVSKFRAWANTTKAAAKQAGVWPLTLGVSMDSGAGREFDPTASSADEYRGGSMAMVQAIVDSDLGSSVWWDQHGSGDVSAGWSDDTGRDWSRILSYPSNVSMEGETRRAGTVRYGTVHLII
jgi:hypothetical protein